MKITERYEQIDKVGIYKLYSIYILFQLQAKLRHTFEFINDSKTIYHDLFNRKDLLLFQPF